MAGVLDFILENRAVKRQAADDATRSRGVSQLTGRSPIELEGIEGLFPAESVGGSGLLADPTSLQNQIKFATGLEELPGGGGVGLLSSIFGDESAGERTAATIDQSEVESLRTRSTSLENTQARIAEEARQFGIASGIDADQAGVVEARAAAEENRKRAAERRAEEDQAAERLKRPRRVVNPMPRELSRAGPDAGSTLVDPLKTAGNQRNLDTAGLIIGNVNEFTDLLDQFGSEFINDEARGKMAALRSGILLRASSLREAGAPQAAELEINAQALPDPNTFGARLNPFEKDRFLSSWNTFGEEMKENYLGLLSTDPSTIADFELLGPEFLEANDIGPEMLQFIKANRGLDVPIGQ